MTVPARDYLAEFRRTAPSSAYLAKIDNTARTRTYRAAVDGCGDSGSSGSSGTTSRAPGATPADPGEFDERAGLVEYAANVPRPLAEAFAVICTMPRPTAFEPARWREIVDDAGKLIDRWGTQAIALGWRPLELIGCDPVAPVGRLDRAGLALLICGGEVLALTGAAATIRCRSGALQTCGKPKGQAVLLSRLAGDQ